MDTLAFLDVLIGMVFIYAFLALACTALNEFILNSLYRQRGRTLREGIRYLLGAGGENSLLNQFHRHPMIRSLHKPGKLPSKIPASSFARSVLDLFITVDSEGKARLREDRGFNTGDAPVFELITQLPERCGFDYEKMQDEIELWFNNATDRMIGWYKRKMQLWAFIFAVIITVTLNVDSIDLMKELYSNPALRKTIVTMAEKNKTVEELKKTIGDDYKSYADALMKTGLPLGWDLDFSNLKLYLLPAFDWSKVAIKARILNSFNTIMVFVFELCKEARDSWLGWVLSILAISLGAPFWFDLLKRLMNLKSVLTEDGHSETS